MANENRIHIRIDPETKEKAYEIYDRLGMTMTQAIKAFLMKSIMVGGLPFEMRENKDD